MKKYLFFVVCIYFNISIKAQSTITNQADSVGPILTLDSTILNFGTVMQGTPVERLIRIKNTGNAMLKISTIETSDGTSIDHHYPKYVSPGSYDWFSVTLLTTGEKGKIDKTVTIQSNNHDGNIVLHFRGKVSTDSADMPVMVFDSVKRHFRNSLQGEMVEFSFHFRNTGKTPLVISKVVPSFPVTNIRYQNSQIRPNGSEEISYRYYTTSKLGSQNQTITVYSNNKKGTVVLHALLNVIADTVARARIVFDFITWDFGEIVGGPTIEHDYPFTNTGKTPLIIREAHGSGPNFCEYSKEPIRPGGKGTIRMHLWTENKIGYQNKICTLTIDGCDTPVVLYITGNLIVANPNAPVPNMRFDSTFYDFGKLKSGKTASHTFHFTNTGKAPLVIMECNSYWGDKDINVTYTKDTIPPGGSGIVIVQCNKFDTQSPKGKWYKNITVIDNTYRKVELNVYAEIIPPNSP